MPDLSEDIRGGPSLIMRKVIKACACRSEYSNFGPKLDLVAPSEGIRTFIATLNSPNGYETSGYGTSYAAAMVSGVCPN
jgi:hypothetical protein